MPVRSLHSSILKWPNKQDVDRAVRSWIRTQKNHHNGVIRAGYFGSYADNSWGVGSDIDVVVIVDRDPLPFEGRSAGWDTSSLPVPTDLLVYTLAEWLRAIAAKSRFAEILNNQTVWID